jgi:type VI secretion system VgrG family protein
MSQFHFTFSYQHQGSQTKELTILHFTGQEGISELFNFDLELKSDDIELDADGVVNQSCKIEVYYGDNATPLRVIHGFINEFEDVNYFPDSTLYRAKVVPRVWQLGHFETNEVYLKETIEQTLTVILEDASFVKDQDFRFELSRTYRAWPFRLQYNETHLDYLQRIIEREGIYYYFEHTNDSDVMVFCDNNQALPKIEKSAQADNVVFQANSGVYVDSHANTINSIICKRHTLPKKVTLRDFNDETPSLDIRGEFVINSTGVGDINLYGLNIVSPEEGQALAEIHANAYLSHQKTYIGQGDVANMIVGHRFSLQDHPRDSFNQLNYLLEGIEHEGANLNQYQALHADVAAPVNYTNSFSALSTEHEYAPKRQRVAPEINGTLNAVIDTEADSGYAELDDTGRYKVKLPFDRKDRNGGKASHWVRMMQPYGGANEGMHFPLRNGTRVLLGFIGGDPDRPFISGTINDSGDQQSIVTANNQTNNVIKTASGNKIEFEDKEGSQRLKLESPTNKTYLHLGAANHDGAGYVMVTEGIERRDIGGGQRVNIKTIPDEILTAVEFSKENVYGLGDLVKKDNKNYKCISAITTKGNSFNATNWQEIVANTIAEFDASKDYSEDTQVIHNGDTYKCTEIIDNNSLFDASNWAEDTTISAYFPIKGYSIGDLVIYEGTIYQCKESIQVLRSDPVGLAVTLGPQILEAFDPSKWEKLPSYSHSNDYSVNKFVIHDNKVYKCKAAVEASTFDSSKWENLDLTYSFYNKELSGSGDSHLESVKEYSGSFITRRTEGKSYTVHRGAQFQFFRDLDFGLPSTTEDAENKYPDNVSFSYGPKFEANHIDATAGFDDAYNLLIRTSADRKKNADTTKSAINKGSAAQLTDSSLFEIDQTLLASMRTNIEQFDKVNLHIGRTINIKQASSDDDVEYKYNADGKLIYAKTGDYAAKWDGDVLNMVFEESNDITRKWNKAGKLISYEQVTEKDDKGDKSTKKTYDGDGDQTSYVNEVTNYTETWTRLKSGDANLAVNHTLYDGAPVAFERVAEPAPGATFSFKGDGLPTIAMEMAVDVGETKLSTHIGAMSNSVEMDATLMKNALSISVTGMDNAVEISGAIMQNSVSISGCPFKTEIEIGTGGLEKFESTLPALNIKAEAFATKMEKEALVTLAKQQVAMKAAEVKMDQWNAKLGLGSVKIDMVTFLMMG